MAYEYTAQTGKLDAFTLMMMRDVLADHATIKNHDTGFCCQVAASYERRVAAHDAIVNVEKVAKAQGQDVFTAATDNQARYIRSLARRIPLHMLSPEHRAQAETVQAQNEISKDDAKVLIDAMKSLAEGTVGMRDSSPEDRGARLISPAQLGFLKKLLAEREHSLTLDLANLGDLPMSLATKHITTLKNSPVKGDKTEGAKVRHTPDEGIYVVEGVFFKVIVSERTGNTTARQWDTETEKWVYVGQKPFRLLTEYRKATAEQASKFGELYHRCVFCTKQLTREESETAGYGPICAEKNNLPWG
jgi:hypothetical protein